MSFWVEGDDDTNTNRQTPTQQPPQAVPNASPQNHNSFDEGYQLGVRLAEVIQQGTDPLTVFSTEELTKIRISLQEANIPIPDTASPQEMFEALAGIAMDMVESSSLTFWKRACALMADFTSEESDNANLTTYNKQLDLIKQIVSGFENKDDQQIVDSLINELSQLGELPEKVVEMLCAELSPLG
ncbi:hypothetical protein GEMRC1_011470 [Eukaryota sp. GEM-RC1]